MLDIKSFLSALLKNKNTIRVQLITSFILINFATISICILILFIYTKNILTNDFKELTLKQFQQLSYNLGATLKEVNNISLSVGTNGDIDTLIFNDTIPDVTKVEKSVKAFKFLDYYLNTYEYIDSIICYGDNGMIISKEKNTNKIFDASAGSVINNRVITNQSGIIRQSVSQLNQQFFSGEYSSKNFVYYETSSLVRKEDIKLISHIRSFTSRQGSRQRLTIVININEAIFKALYNSAEVNKDYNTYMIDSGGKIVSHPDISQINTESPFIDKEIMKSESGDFIYNNASVSKQVVFCRIPGTSLLLVRETPVNSIIKEVTKAKQIFVFILIANIILVFILSMTFIRKIINPLSRLTNSMHKIEQGEIEQTITDLPDNEIGILNLQFNKMSKSIIELLQKNTEMEKQRREMEMQALQSQINPHFLYNTLNTLKWMALMFNAKQVAEGLTAMGNLLQPLYRNRGVVWTISQEYELIRNFVKIMNYRYGGGVVVSFSVPEELMDYLVLRFILQPVLENSFLHGLKINSTSSEISVKAWSETETICFEIEDNGNGIDEKQLLEIRQSFIDETDIYSENGIGISNVSRRIKIHYGSQYGVSIDSKEGIGTRVLIHIPKIHKDSQ